ncbi:MAG: 2-oxoacid:acceptor oxidoreductase subunit alpha [Candidatus Omnitrophota bacterium]|nr:MAG: 2-oxoacid:acceptor oxidoreductase subunit alpha [Candidatus Omnitrophota bacterium]
MVSERHYRDRTSILVGEHFWQGDIAIAEGAIAADCRFFAGYPITPASEIAERMSLRLPFIGGVYIQLEDELASMAAILGASWTGTKAMTATSGPGLSLMLENFGLGIMTETPCVIVNVQRGSPSTGLPTFFGQADMMQARWGSHGDYEVIALAPSSAQECFDFTITAFNLSEKYRLPVFILTDGLVGHMTEKVVVPSPSEIKVFGRRKTKKPPQEYLPYEPEADLVPQMANFGEGYRLHTTGLTHDERGYPDMTIGTQDRLIRRLMNKIRQNADDIIIVEEKDIEDADVVVVSYGVTSRVVPSAVEKAKRDGIKIGQLRLITVWPFPEKRISELSEKVKAWVVPEINLGQIVREVERSVGKRSKVALVSHAGGDVHDPEDIYKVIKEVIQ